jgi:pyridine nucleotide-disulfide oxidoreductase family protein
VKHVLLLGAGHAHAWLLAALAEEPLRGARLTLVSPYPRQIYSAMLPGLIAGHYSREEAEFDVAALAERAFTEFIPGTVAKLDVARRVAILSDGRELAYDIASLNVGSRTDDTTPGARERALSVKPFERLLEQHLPSEPHIAIAGGGAGGVELAMALRYRGAEVTLYSERSNFAPELGERIERALRRRRVDFRPGMRVDALEEGPVVVAGRSRQQFDIVLWATGATPLGWLGQAGLALDERGFVRVDAMLRSVSHPEVFAVGDCAALDEPKSGVHAVRHGRALAHNLRALITGTPLAPYERSPHALWLITCGARYAIAARGGSSAEGRWAWWWKNWIDRRWMARLRGPKKRG